MQLKKLFLLFCGAIVFSPLAAAQFTTVTGTVTDVNGSPYDCGTISATLVTLGGASPTLNGGGFSGSMSPIGLGCTTTPGSGAAGSFTARLADNTVISPGGTQWLFLVNISPGILPPAGFGARTCTATLTISGSSQSITSSFNSCPALSRVSGSAAFSGLTPGTNSTAGTFAFNGNTLDLSSATSFVPPNGFFQTRSFANSSQTGLNLVNDVTVGGVTVTNTSGNTVSGALSNIYAPTGSTQVLAGLISGPLQGDILQLDSSLRPVNKTPGVAVRTTASATDTTSCAAGGDRGTEIILTNASNPVSTTPQAGVTCLSNFYTRFWGTGATGFTLKAITSTVNGIAGATGIPYPGNTFVDLLPDSTGNNFTANASRAVKAGLGMGETLNLDGTVSMPILGASSFTTGFIQKWNSTQFVNTLCDEAITVANRITCTDTAGLAAPIFISTGATAGFTAFTQGSTSSGVAPCNNANTKCIQAGAAVTYNLETLAPATAQGIFAVTGTAAATTEMYSGDSGHSATVTIGSGTSIGSTSLCSTANCPVGTYIVNAYLDITTACTTTGTYSVSLVYTDDQGSKTIVIPMQGPGESAGVLTLSAVANFGQAVQVLRSTGAASINYLTTATACGSGGPMAGKLYLSAVPVQ